MKKYINKRLELKIAMKRTIWKMRHGRWYQVVSAVREYEE